MQITKESCLYIDKYDIMACGDNQGRLLIFDHRVQKPFVQLIITDFEQVTPQIDFIIWPLLENKIKMILQGKTACSRTRFKIKQKVQETNKTGTKLSILHYILQSLIHNILYNAKICIIIIIIIIIISAQRE